MNSITSKLPHISRRSSSSPNPFNFSPEKQNFQNFSNTISRKAPHSRLSRMKVDTKNNKSKPVIDLPPILQNLYEKTSFTPQELISYKKLYAQICKKNKTHEDKVSISRLKFLNLKKIRSFFGFLITQVLPYLKIEQFQEFMNYLCINISPFLAKRIFRLMDTDNDKCLDFMEFMLCFDQLINGDEKAKAKFCFSLISLSGKKPTIVKSTQTYKGKFSIQKI